MSEPFALDAFFQAVADGVRARADLFSSHWRILFVIRSAGAFLLDTRYATIRPVGEGAEADAAMTTDMPSLAALAEGRLDPAAPEPGQVCILTGDRRAWDELGSVLAGL